MTNAETPGYLPDSLYSHGNYKLAALEYERLIFKGQSMLLINGWRYKRALCFKQMGDFSRAEDVLSKITYWNLPDSLMAKYRYETALCDYLNGDFTEVLFQSKQIDDSIILQKPYRQNLLLLEALSNNELMQWRKAQEKAVEFIKSCYRPPVSDSLCNVLDLYYSKTNLPYLKSERKANVLKMIPGLGQIYTGRTVEGLFNFVLNLSFLSFGAYEVYEGYYITGYFVGAIGLNKVYFGGHTRTAYLLNKYNYEQKKDFCEKIKSLLITKKAD